jgi:hypothetical protein
VAKNDRDTPAGTVWLECDGQEFHVEHGSEAEARLLEKGATVLDTASDVNELDDLTVAELRDLAEERGVDVPSDAKKADLVAALEADGGSTLAE